MAIVGLSDGKCFELSKYLTPLSKQMLGGQPFTVTIMASIAATPAHPAVLKLFIACAEASNQGHDRFAQRRRRHDVGGRYL